MSPFILQKTKEISLAFLKISALMSRKSLSSKIEKLAFNLVEHAAEKNARRSISDLEALSLLAALAVRIYELSPSNERVLQREINLLVETIKQEAKIEEYVDVQSLFSQEPREFTGSFAKTNNQPKSADSNENGKVIKNGNANGNGNGIGATIRQSAIINKIRQSGKAALKDIIAEFPNVSERTLRYDLHKLCSQNIIEKVGNGGPSTYYVLRV